MNRRRLLRYIGACGTVLAILWVIAAPALSAYLIISLTAELASYWLCFFAVVGAGYVYLRTENPEGAQKRYISPPGCMAFAVGLIIILWLSSDREFDFWKKRALPAQVFPQMISDFGQMAKDAARSGTNYLSSRTPLPRSLQQLGLGEDYTGGMGNVWNTTQYTGPVGGVVFGNRVRRWGLCIGPEQIAKEFCHNGSYSLVGSNAYLFFGTGD
jgi:hypothetical protein